MLLNFWTLGSKVSIGCGVTCQKKSVSRSTIYFHLRGELKGGLIQMHNYLCEKLATNVV